MVAPRSTALLAACLAAAAVASCAATDDLSQRYGLGETESVLLLRYPDYLDARLDPSGAGDRGRWIRGKEVASVLEPLEAAETSDLPVEARPAFALAFCPPDPGSPRTLVLDQYLNVWPGFRYLGETYDGSYNDPGPGWKKALLGRIAELPGGLAHLDAVLDESAGQEKGPRRE